MSVSVVRGELKVHWLCGSMLYIKSRQSWIKPEYLFIFWHRPCPPLKTRPHLTTDPSQLIIKLINIPEIPRSLIYPHSQQKGLWAQSLTAAAVWAVKADLVCVFVLHGVFYAAIPIRFASHPSMQRQLHDHLEWNCDCFLFHHTNNGHNWNWCCRHI